MLAILMVLVSAARGTEYLTINGEDVDSIHLNLDESCTIEVVSTGGGMPYMKKLYPANFSVSDLELIEIKPEAGSGASATAGETEYQLMAGTGMVAGVHFVFGYTATSTGQNEIQLRYGIGSDVIDSVVINVTSGPAGTAFTYQGRLTDANSVADGLYDLQFKLFNDPSDGNQVGSDVNKPDVDVIEGYFTVKLDFGAGVFNGDPRWLEIGVRPGEQNDPDVYTVLEPRQEITPTPYALQTRGIFVDDAGNVGIGTSSPVWELNVANLMPGDGAEAGVIANDAGGGIAAYSSTLPFPVEHLAGRVSLFSDGETMGLDLRADSLTSDMRFYTGGPWPWNEKMRIASNGGIRLTSYRDDGLGSWEEGLYFANNSNGMGPWSHAGIWADGVSGYNGELVFGVDGDETNNLTGIQEAMRINSYGNVGIGTMYPGQKLHVSNIDAMSAGTARLSNDLGTYLDIGVSGSSAGWIVGDDNPYIFTENQNLVIYTGSGLVGIGTAYPSDGKLCIANSATDEAYISLNPCCDAINDIMGIRVSESGNNTTKLHFGREFTYDSAFVDLVTMDPEGNVGIGTTSPTEKLTVRGNLLIQSESTGDPVLELGEGLDYAEGFDVSARDKINAGSVLIIDADNPGKLALSNKSYDTKVAGIVAGAKGLGSGVRLGAGQFDYDVALAGRVYCMVDATDEAIQAGDLLTTSATPGYAMKAADYTRSQGAILGKAMESLEKGHKGQILVLVTLQ